LLATAAVAALHVRNVPADVVEASRARAASEGRSLNAQVVLVLADAAARRSLEDVLASIEERAELASWRRPDAPNPEALIRRDRDSR
jgi:plasmid stability protein